MRLIRVSDHAVLRCLLDGKQILERRFDAVPAADKSVKPEYRSTTLVKQYNIYQADYDLPVGFEVPAGEHTITLEVTDGDWLAIQSYRLTGYRSSKFMPLRLYGICDGVNAYLWIQNESSTWKNVADKHPVPPVPETRTTVYGLADRNYMVQWWDTRSGVIVRREEVTSVNRKLPLHLPPIATDIAAKVLFVRTRR